MGTYPAVINRDLAPKVIRRLLDNPVTLLIARIAVTAPFLVGGFMKLLDWQAGENEMLRAGLHPTWAFNLATLIVELGGSALVIASRRVWLGAGALGVFTVLATALAHRFWEFEGSARTMQLNSFFEHWTISAAFILVAVLSFRDPARTSA
jgi:transmembrane protein